MKKILIVVCSILLWAVTANAATIAPMTGTWHIDGLVAMMDPENDGLSIGDEARARDSSENSRPGYGYYYYMNELRRDTLDLGEIVDNGDGTGSQSLRSERSGGIFSIHGENLFGSEFDNIYTVSIDGIATGKIKFVKDGSEWHWRDFEGKVHWWGSFDEFPNFYFDFTANAVMDKHTYFDPERSWMYWGDLQNVEITISAVPVPGSVLLLGLGLLTLIPFRKKIFSIIS